MLEHNLSRYHHVASFLLTPRQHLRTSSHHIDHDNVQPLCHIQVRIQQQMNKLLLGMGRLANSCSLHHRPKFRRPTQTATKTQ